MKIHPHPQSLEALASSLSREDRAMLRHLMECGPCRRRFDALLGRPAEPLTERLAEVLPWPGRRPTDYGPAIAAAEERFLAHAQLLAKERAVAPARLAELLQQPPQRREMLVRHHARFQTWGFLERLIDHAWEECLTAPGAAEELAALAVSLTDLLDADRYGAERIEDLRARAWGFVGNARRVGYDLQGAEEAFDIAFTHLRQGTGDLLERALLFEIRASLYRAQRRLEDAERLLLQAIRIYREVGEENRIGRVLVNMTNVYEVAGTPERSVPLLHEALRVIDPEREPRLLWGVYHNLITALTETGRYMEAQGLLIQARPLYAQFPDGHTQNRHHWIAGKIAGGLGQTQEAETHLRAARDGFIASGVTYEAALVSLDLCAVYGRQGLWAEVRRTAEELLTLFSSRQIHREALAALTFLQQAARSERASLEVVTGVAAFLKRLQNDPELSFVQPAGR